MPRHVDEVLENLRMEMTRPVTEEDVRILLAVDKRRKPILTSAFLQMIDNGCIIEYREKVGWYSVHPLLRDMIKDVRGNVAYETK